LQRGARRRGASSEQRDREACPAVRHPRTVPRPLCGTRPRVGQVVARAAVIPRASARRATLSTSDAIGGVWFRRAVRYAPR